MEPVTTTRRESEGLETNTPSFFYHSTPGWYSHAWEQSSIYNRLESSAILGEACSVSEETENTVPQQDASRCFNCGDTDHKLSACPIPSNRELIALSRQYYQFFNGSGPQWQRIHTFESRRQQRLDWLEDFQPGEIRGDLLRSALAESNDEWLRNICAWGYPPGWFSEVDPRERVRARIWKDHVGVDDSLEEFKIHGEDDVEAVSIRLDNVDESPDWEKLDGNAGSEVELDSNASQTSSRWARYPNHYFSSDFLFLYTPAVPSPAPPSWDDTSFVDTTSYLCRRYFVPRPPSPTESPPPLPPETPMADPPPPPPIPPDAYHLQFQISLDDPASDMEMSDSE